MRRIEFHTSWRHWLFGFGWDLNNRTAGVSFGPWDVTVSW